MASNSWPTAYKQYVVCNINTDMWKSIDDMHFEVRWLLPKLFVLPLSKSTCCACVHELANKTVSHLYTEAKDTNTVWL